MSSPKHRENPEYHSSIGRIRNQFLRDLARPIWQYAMDRSISLEGVEISEDIGLKQFFHFLSILESQFQLDLSRVFQPGDERYGDFVDFFADTYVRELGEIAALRRQIVTHRHPSGLHPESSAEFHKAHMFPALLSCFIHFGQYRFSENRPYIFHIREVRNLVASMYEPLSTSLLQQTDLHDGGEDFGHRNGNIRRAGLSPKRDQDFFHFLCQYFDKTLGSANYPPFFRDLKIANFPTGEAFHRAVSIQVPFSASFRDLSKIPGFVPGNHKDRYRDWNRRMYEILSIPDPRIRFLRFVQYMLAKSADMESNYYSYFQQSDEEVKTARRRQDPEVLAYEDFKRIQMEAMVRHVVLPFMAQTGATLAHYRTLDAVRVPEFNLRVQFTGALDAYFNDHGEKSATAHFQRRLFALAGERFQLTFKKPLPERSFQVVRWRRGIYDIKSQIRDVINHKKPHDERKFMHIIDIRVLHPDPKTAQHIKSVLESCLASFAPVEDRTSLQAERKHPFIGKVCKVRSDLPVKRDDEVSYGYVVYSLRTLAEVRRDLEGLVSSIYLNQDRDAFEKMSRFLDTLGQNVIHLEQLLIPLEEELRYLKSTGIEEILRRVRSTASQVLDFFEAGDDVSGKTLFGTPRADNHENLHAYAKEVSQLYYLIKEQVLTHMLPRVSLQRFQVVVHGKKKNAPVDSVTLPRDANPLYALFYYFPFETRYRIKSIRVVRPGRQHYAGDVEALKHLTLQPGDDVVIDLDSTQVDEQNIELVKRFGRTSLYPSKTVPLDE